MTTLAEFWNRNFKRTPRGVIHPDPWFAPSGGYYTGGDGSAPHGAPPTSHEHIQVNVAPVDLVEEWPPLPESWTYTYPLPARPHVTALGVCRDPLCGCRTVDFTPLVTRIAETMERLNAPPREYRWGDARLVVQRERQILYTGSQFRWTVRDRTLERDYYLDLELIDHEDGPLLGSFDRFTDALAYVVSVLEDAGR